MQGPHDLLPFLLLQASFELFVWSKPEQNSMDDSVRSYLVLEYILLFLAESGWIDPVD